MKLRIRRTMTIVDSREIDNAGNQDDAPLV